MSDLLSKVSGGLGGLEKLVAGIPGYKGYKEKEMRREADRILRETLARKYEDQWARLSGVQKRLMSAGGIEYLDDVEGAASKLRGFIDKLKTAAMGYGACSTPSKSKRMRSTSSINSTMRSTTASCKSRARLTGLKPPWPPSKASPKPSAVLTTSAVFWSRRSSIARKC